MVIARSLHLFFIKQLEVTLPIRQDAEGDEEEEDEDAAEDEAENKDEMGFKDLSDEEQSFPRSAELVDLQSKACLADENFLALLWNPS